MTVLNEEQTNGEDKEKPDSRWFNCTPRRIMQYVGTDLFRNQIENLFPELRKDIFIHNFKNMI